MANPLKVMVLEDDPSLRFALTQVLEGEGHRVFAAANISQAVEVLLRVAPDVLLLDLMIGREYSIQIADLAGYRVPNAEVIYLTGSNMFPNGELYKLSQNASWVLRKPIDFFELKSMLTHLQNTLSESSVSPSKSLDRELA